MARSPEQGGFRETAGKAAIALGIVGGIIGLLSRPDLLIASGFLVGGGWWFKNSGKKQ